jgi:hypothetical protein
MLDRGIEWLRSTLSAIGWLGIETAILFLFVTLAAYWLERLPASVALPV